MADLNWSQFEKRLRNNLRVMWYKSVKGERFELSKRTLDWDGEHKFTEGIAVCGIRYTDKVTENRREVVRERDFLCANYSNGSHYAAAVMHRLPLKNLNTRNIKLLGYDCKHEISFGSLFKSRDFGGGSTSLDIGQLKWGHLGHYADLCNFNLLPPGKQIELYWLNDFNKLISDEREKLMKSSGNRTDVCLDLKIDGTVIHNVIGAMGAPGASRDPKADVVFVTCKDGCLEYTGYASLKDGTRVQDFQQWGGISSYADHKEVKEFAEALKIKYPDGISAAGGGVNVGREIEDRSLKIEAIYGPQYQRGRYGSDSVQFIIQGSPNGLRKSGSVYTLNTGGGKQVDDSTTSQNKLLSGDARPVFMARADNNRNDLGVPGTRVFIYSVGGRSKWEWI